MLTSDLVKTEPCLRIAEEALSEVGSAVRLSAHVLARDGTQLKSQLHARLMGSGNPRVRGLVDQFLSHRGCIWLRALSPSLAQPGGDLVRTVYETADTVCLTADGTRVISTSAESPSVVRVWDLATGRQECTLQRHRGRVRGLSAQKSAPLACPHSAAVV